MGNLKEVTRKNSGQVMESHWVLQVFTRGLWLKVPFHVTSVICVQIQFMKINGGKFFLFCVMK